MSENYGGAGAAAQQAEILRPSFGSDKGLEGMLSTVNSMIKGIHQDVINFSPGGASSVGYTSSLQSGNTTSKQKLIYFGIGHSRDIFDASKQAIDEALKDYYAELSINPKISSYDAKFRNDPNKNGIHNIQMNVEIDNQEYVGSCIDEDPIKAFMLAYLSALANYVISNGVDSASLTEIGWVPPTEKRKLQGWTG